MDDDISRKLKTRIDGLIQTGYRGQALMSEVFGDGGLLDKFCESRLERSRYLKTKGGRAIAAFVRAAASQAPRNEKQRAMLEMAENRRKQIGIRGQFPRQKSKIKS